MTKTIGPRDRNRSFAVSVGSVLCAIAVALAWRGHLGRAEVFGAIGVVLVALGLTRPAWLKIPSDAWWAIAGVLGWINARVLLTLAFLLLLTPISLLWRLTGKDPMARHRASFPGWTPYPSRYRDARHFDRMF